MYQTQLRSSEVIADVLDGRNLTDTLSSLWRKQPELEPRQRAAIQDVSYGTLRRLGELDFMLQQLLLKPTSDALIHSLLLTTMYQLAWGRSAPHALVDHAVQVSSRINDGRAKSLVNAILRNFLRQKDALLAASHEEPAARWNHPQWWIKAMRRAYPQDWQALLTANNQHPPMSLRVNRRKISVADYLARLAASDVAGTAIGKDGILLTHPVGIDRLPGFGEGLCSVQDLGAQLAATLLDAGDGMTVLDACAAPGGKTGHLLEIADVTLTALDNDSQRLKRVQSNLDRLGLQAKLLVADASRPKDWWDGQPYDRILADVPCSATGVARRHPDIKWLRRPTDFAQFAVQQAKMLDALWTCLAVGGKLLYATCSVFPEENEKVVASFLSRQPNAQRLPLSIAATTDTSTPNTLPAADLPPHGQLLPNDTHDGFFYALLAKI